MTLFRLFCFLMVLVLVAFVKPSQSLSIIRMSMEQEDTVTTIDSYKTPKYKVLNKTETYELREYPKTNWVATTSVGSAGSNLFMRLFKYIGGENEAKSKIEMTVPVATKIEPGEGKEQNFTMNFFLTTADSPKPTNKDVFLVSYPSFKAYVKTYGGYTSDQKRLENLHKLMEDVGQNNYDLSYYFSCGYDAPWKLWNRRNEIWLLAK